MEILFRNLSRLRNKPMKHIVVYIFRRIKEYGNDHFFLKYKIRFVLFNLLNLLPAGIQRTVEGLWDYFSSCLFFSQIDPCLLSGLNNLVDKDVILGAAEQAIAHKISLLGTGIISLGEEINWHRDYKTGVSWPEIFYKKICYVNPNDKSDVKIPWEISRLQWLIPVGQAYVLTGDERYALGAKKILIDWIQKNPCSIGVNWTCTMEVALRILSFSWFFHVFNKAVSWQDASFQTQFLETLYLHADFVYHHLEYSHINGNHYVADAAGLVFAGLLFDRRKAAKKWLEKGWSILTTEISKQVFEDGVDYEASIPYHRLVTELFLYPAIFRKRLNLEVPEFYKQRLLNMGKFVAAYSRQDGSAPLIGDADDGRALPFGNQVLNDHRYLIGVIGLYLNNEGLSRQFTGDISELVWIFGPKVMASSLTSRERVRVNSDVFQHGGFYVMRNETDHVFIDCGPVGLAGLGGHGHNDCLSFCASILGEELIVDSGSYVYTADFEARNRFRSTASHNTPQVDSQEINRFIGPDNLWNLHYDAKPHLISWEQNDAFDQFAGTHTGYQRLAKPLSLNRTITLDHQKHILSVVDEFESQGEHNIEIPYHFSPNITIVSAGDDRFELFTRQIKFQLIFEVAGDWIVENLPTLYSSSYGVCEITRKLVFKARMRASSLRLKITILPV